MGFNYKIRKFYVKINPLLDIDSCSDRTQWIMRDSPLISDGIPFFFEPFINPDDWWGINGRRSWHELIHVFCENLHHYIKHRINTWKR